MEVIMEYFVIFALTLLWQTIFAINVYMTIHMLSTGAPWYITALTAFVTLTFMVASGLIAVLMEDH